MIFGEEGKPSLEELAHHGVRGMRWGQHKSSTASSTSSTSAKKPTSAEIIGARARARHNARIVALDEKADRLSKAKTQVEKEAILKDIHSISKKGLASGDHVVAGKVTTGEKVISNILLTGVGGHLAKKHGAKQSAAAEQRLKEYNRSKLSDYYHE